MWKQVCKIILDVRRFRGPDGWSGLEETSVKGDGGIEVCMTIKE